MATVLSGKAWASEQLAALEPWVRTWTQEHRRAPRIVSIFPPEDDASVMYTKLKRADATSIGVEYDAQPLSLNADRSRWLSTVIATASNLNVDAIIVQKPSKAVFTHVTGQPEAAFSTWWDAVIQSIPPEKDVDGLTPQTLQRLAYAAEKVTTKQEKPQEHLDAWLLPATAQAVMEALFALIGSSEVLRRERFAVVGKSAIVGAPVARALELLGCSVQLLGSRDDLVTTLPTASVVVAATGREHLIQPEWLAPNSVLIDCGAPKPEFQPACYEQARAYTPVPGGIGPMTRACLLLNVQKCVE